MNAVESDTRTWAMLAHLAALAGYVVPLGNVIGPLVVWLSKRDTMPFVDYHGRESLNFHITIAIGYVVLFLLAFLSVFLSIIMIGFLLMPLVILLIIGLGVFELVITIMAALEANRGNLYRYPFSLRLIS